MRHTSPPANPPNSPHTTRRSIPCPAVSPDEPLRPQPATADNPHPLHPLHPTSQVSSHPCPLQRRSAPGCIPLHPARLAITVRLRPIHLTRQAVSDLPSSLPTLLPNTSIPTSPRQVSSAPATRPKRQVYCTSHQPDPSAHLFDRSPRINAYSADKPPPYRAPHTTGLHEPPPYRHLDDPVHVRPPSWPSYPGPPRNRKENL